MEIDFERKYLESQAEIRRLSASIEDLQQQLKRSLDGNEELRNLLKDLQAKLDVLIAQSKKNNKRVFGKKTEKHNPRPAITQPKPAPLTSADPPTVKLTGSKHILNNSKNLAHQQVHHTVKPAQTICPTCIVEMILASGICPGVAVEF